MDQAENQKQLSLSQFIKSQFHRKLTRLLLSVSVFSLLFSRSCWLSLLHSFSFNFHNTLPFQLFSHTIDKNFIFLLFNGLLVFLAKYSGLISSSSKYNLSDDQPFKSYEDVPQAESIVLEPKAPLSEKEVALEADEAVKNSIVIEGRQEEEAAAAEIEIETENFTMEEEEEDGEKWGLMTSEEEEEEEENDAFVGEDEGELKGSDEGNRVLSTEELNKKFDEFIRKMKEELRIEARQQLVTV